MKLHYLTTFALIILSINGSYAQKTNIERKIFTNIEDASKNPDSVFSLDLSDTKFDSFPQVIFKFKNLQYLNLRNDHLKELPKEISNLKKLKRLDLSGNDFRVLPESIKDLKNLSELYLSDNNNQNFDVDFNILRKLPNLRILHLEHNGISILPKSINKLKHLEKLYLNENEIKEFPSFIVNNKQLIYLDMKNNPLQWKQERPFGLTVNF